MLGWFAHAGHSHEAAATAVPWWQDEPSVSIVLITGFFGILAIAHFVAKAKFGTKLNLAMAYLLVAGVLCYTVAPILSIVALSLGMATALATTMLQLAHIK